MPSCRRLAAMTAAIGLMAIIGGPQAAAQSFNCRTAERPDEILICQRPELSALDSRMSSLYFRLRNNLGGAARARLVADQTAWLRSRMACGRDYDCVRDAYEERIRDLRRY